MRVDYYNIWLSGSAIVDSTQIETHEDKCPHSLCSFPSLFNRCENSPAQRDECRLCFAEIVIDITQYVTCQTGTATLPEHLSSSPVFLVRSMFFIFLVFVLPICVFTVLVPCCDVRYDFHIKTMFSSSLPPVVFVGGLMSYCVFVYVCEFWCPTYIDYMGIMVGVSLEAVAVYPSRAPWFTSCFGVVVLLMILVFYFWFFVCLFCYFLGMYVFVLCLVYQMFTGWSILRFSLAFIYQRRVDKTMAG